LKRIKRRYLALKLECESLPTEREFMDAVWASVAKLYGEVGASQTSLALINLDIDRKVAIIRVSLAALNLIKASLATITSLTGREATFHVVAVSGTLKALYASLK